MWKKTDEDAVQPMSPSPAAPPPQRNPAPSQRATIGPSITVKGDLAGDEDLIVQGRLEGEIALPKNNVTIGKSGKVKADIRGQTIHVEGEVKGNLIGEQEVVIRASGKVEGNIVCPRVTLENGSKFKGAIDMEPKAAPAPAQRGPERGGPPSAPPGGSDRPSAGESASARAAQPAKPSASGG